MLSFMEGYEVEVYGIVVQTRPAKTSCQRRANKCSAGVFVIIIGQGDPHKSGAINIDLPALGSTLYLNGKKHSCKCTQ